MEAEDHDMIVSLGDEQIHATCKCGSYFGYILPSGSVDALALVWEKHVMTGTPNERIAGTWQHR